MTLIISVITHSYVIQASDRRLTMLQDGEVVGHEDARNKAIFVAERMSFAMTGIADIDGDTVEFFTARLAHFLATGLDLDGALNAVGGILGQYVAQHASLSGQRLAFLGVGWTAVPPAPRSPLLMWVSNSMDSHGEWTARSTAGFTTGAVELLHDEPLLLLVSGAGLPHEQTEQLRLDVVGAVMSSDDPEPVGRILIEHIRKAASVNPLIGACVMVNCIPYACGRPNGEILFIGGLPCSDTRTFTYVPEGQATGPYLGPHVVGSRGERLGGFQGFGEPGTFGFSYGVTYNARPKAAVGQRIRESKTGRNAPCWCGSGEKLKRCHGR